MITLAIGQIVWGVAYRWISITNGDNGISVSSRPSPLGLSLAAPAHFYWATLVVFLAALGSIAMLVASPFGASLRGTRDQPRRMAALGPRLDDPFPRSSSRASGAGGGLLFLYYNQFVGPQAVALTASAEALLMVIAGGSGTLLGPVVGAGLVVVMKNVASAYIERWNFVLGAIFVAIVVFMPEGLVPGAARLWRRATARPAARRWRRARAGRGRPGDQARDRPVGAGADEVLRRPAFVTASVDLTVEAGSGARSSARRVGRTSLQPGDRRAPPRRRDGHALRPGHHPSPGMAPDASRDLPHLSDHHAVPARDAAAERHPLASRALAAPLESGRPAGAPERADGPGARGAGPRRARAPGGAPALADVLRGAAPRGDRHGPGPGPPNSIVGRALRRALHRGAPRRPAAGDTHTPRRHDRDDRARHGRGAGLRGADHRAALRPRGGRGARAARWWRTPDPGDLSWRGDALELHDIEAFYGTATCCTDVAPPRRRAGFSDCSATTAPASPPP